MDSNESAERETVPENSADVPNAEVPTGAERSFPTLGNLAVLREAVTAREPVQPAEQAEETSNSPAAQTDSKPEQVSEPAADPPETEQPDPNPEEPAVHSRPAPPVQDTSSAAGKPDLRSNRLAGAVKLQEAAARQAAQEKERRKRLEQEQAYLQKMMADVESDLRASDADRAFNDQYEAQLREQVYRMHGISADRLEGMAQTRQAWYRGAAFSLFLLSVLLFAACGAVHGFSAQLTLFVAFYTGIEGALLAAGQTPNRVLRILLKILYLLLFPAMMVIFTCYELGFTDYYTKLLPVFTVVGVVVLAAAAASYFVQDHYHDVRRTCRQAERYMRKLEKAADRELRQHQRHTGTVENRRNSSGK